MAFAVKADMRLSDLGLITAGNGYNSADSATSEISLRGDCANSGSATNVSLGSSFFPGTRTLTTSTNTSGATRVNNAVFTILHNASTNIIGTLAWGTAGTYFIARCLNTNSSNLGAKWQLNNSGTSTKGASLSGNDTITWTNGNGTSTTQTFVVTTPSASAGPDFCEMIQVVQAGTAWEAFYCKDDDGGNVHVTSEDDGNGTLTLYDVDGTLP